ncbi:acyltransferase family protein [Roseomonas populi]|uniref:Acyltransferase family protein n=1 Tax=Roseomonas populi TaxID=3121582 RepID=A0ABT1XBJ1_9PROT|nr:acyltransferase family protein [Roseomonas pecuniae]MCR0984798.1 acyltransferase family protein [Roseomonas pecuniae]
MQKEHGNSVLAPDPPRIAFAHGLRGPAALSVLLSHYTQFFWDRRGTAADFLGLPNWTGPAPAVLELHRWLPEGFAGHFGVALFFLISGFVIPFSLLDRGRGAFALGRGLRILPTYAAGLSVTMLAVWACARHFGQPVPFGAAQWATQLLFVRDLLGLPSIDGIVWTLEVEVRFYLLCLLLAPALRAGRVAPLVTASLVMLGTIGAVASFPLPPAGLEALTELAISAQMITFMLVGTVFHAWHRGTEPRRVCLVAGAALLALFAAQWAIGGMAAALVPGLLSYAAALGLFAALFAGRHRIRRVPGPLDGLARISYPLYVVHGVAGFAVMRLLLEAGWGPGAAILAATALAFVAALILHLGVERPTQRAAHRLGR